MLIDVVMHIIMSTLFLCQPLFMKYYNDDITGFQLSHMCIIILMITAVKDYSGSIWVQNSII